MRKGGRTGRSAPPLFSSRRSAVRPRAYTGRMRLLGIDPGTRALGWGVVDVVGTRLSFVAAGVVRADGKAPLAERLALVARELRALVHAYEPVSAAVEDVFVKSDPRAALAIGHGRGVVLAVLGEAGLAVRDYPPATVKRALTGNGRAQKAQVARMVGVLLGETDLDLDASDALAVAVAHATSLRTQAITGQ